MAKRTTRKPAPKARSKAKAKTTTKRAPAKAAAATPHAPRISTAEKARTKSEIFQLISEQTGVQKRQVAEVFDTMRSIIGKDLSRRGPGMFTIPGIAKVTVQRKPATKARKGINPFTGEPTVFKAKPPRNVVKLRALKAVKDLV